LVKKEPDWVFWAAFLIPVGLLFVAARELVSLNAEAGADARVVLVASLIVSFVLAGGVGIRWAYRRDGSPEKRRTPARPIYISIGGTVGFSLFVMSDLLPSQVKIAVMSAFAGVLTAALIATAVAAHRSASAESD